MSLASVLVYQCNADSETHQTEEFLDFTAKQGNDLRSIGGMKAGCKWFVAFRASLFIPFHRSIDVTYVNRCLCASRWYEAFEARGREPAGDKIVPKVFLNATNEKALGKINLEDLKGFAVDKKE